MSQSTRPGDDNNPNNQPDDRDHGDERDDARGPGGAPGLDPEALDMAGQGQGGAGGPDPFDPAGLRLEQDFSTVGARKILTTVPVRKPAKEWFVRTHPDTAYRLQTAVIELKAERAGEIYLVAPSLWAELQGEATFSARAFFTAVTRQGDVFLWPLRLPDAATGRMDEWSRSALEAATLATNRWVRVVPKISLSAYEVTEATGKLSEPQWPGLPFRELIRLAFRDRFINDINHPVLRLLRGEV